MQGMPDITLPFEIIAVAFNGIPVIAFVFALIQIFKSFAPADTSPQIWRGMAVALGIVGCLVWQFRESGTPADPVAWVSAIVTGVVFGYLAMRLYDQTLSDTEKKMLKRVFRGSKGLPKFIDLKGLTPQEAQARLEQALKELVIQQASKPPAPNSAFLVAVDEGGKTPV